MLPMDRTLISVSADSAQHDDVRAFVLQHLRAFNRRTAEPPEFQSLSLALSSDGELIGGLVGEVGWPWLFVELLWVSETYRVRGLGARLLRAAETEDIRRGARHAYLDTLDFQTRPFYERQGYDVFGTLADYPPGHHCYFLKKDLVTDAAATAE